MTILQDLMNESNGAQFHRADLHIHSFGDEGSYDVKDETMTPANIIDTAIAENLRVISIVDHNKIGNVRAAVDYSAGKEILFIPGVELSTPQGHLLVYFETLDKLSRFFGKLNISLDGKACHESIPQCLKYAAEFDGFGVCAHIELDSGIAIAHAKFDAFKQEVFNCENLLGLEIAKIESESWFSHEDEDANRRNCASVRCKTLNLEEGTNLAKIMSSDAHNLVSLGKNANGSRRLTRFKMESPSFGALRIALKDSAARVRLEDLLPPSVPRFIGMKIEGGFLKDQIVRFSPNLTCIIGGRGAGKSTLIESLRVASGNGEEGNGRVDSEIWPDEISLVYEDEVGKQHFFKRRKLSEVVNSDPDGIVVIPIESYGQGETAETIQHADKDPSILLGFLDDFVNVAEFFKLDKQICQALLENQKSISTLNSEILKIPDTEKSKNLADSQVAVLKQQNASEIVELEEKLAVERQFRETLKRNLGVLLGTIRKAVNGSDLRNITADVKGQALVAGHEQFDLVKKIVDRLAGEIDAVSEDLKSKIETASKELVLQLQEWTIREKAAQDRVEEIRRDLEQKKIKLDMAFIRRVTKDAADYASKLTELKKCIPQKEEALKERRNLMQQRIQNKEKMYNVRNEFSISMNRNLAAAVVDYKVTIKFNSGTLSPALENLIKATMGWRTAQVPRAALIASKISPMAFNECIAKNDPLPLTAIKDGDGAAVFSKQDASEILAKMGEWDARCALEVCAYEDRPEILVTRMIQNPAGAPSYQVRNFSKLSLGQQQAILLTILLFSKSKVPLIIDQPEDNLDSEFIYKTVVRSLRSIKEHRQVIIVTHNANIAVLGDAELIVPLRGASELSVIRDRGSIDTEQTKDIVCTILEGSQKAFKRRQEVYGY